MPEFPPEGRDAIVLPEYSTALAPLNGLTLPEEDLELDISLSVLEDLGLRLYSSAPAVLSEIVANSWDADAENVKITINAGDEQSITIEDDGEGMTYHQARKRFLTVGYRRRNEQPTTTYKHSRAVMGRKGIGKLAPLAIADEVDVETRKDGVLVSFVLDVDKIREDIEGGRKHKPELTAYERTTRENGTKITLRRLKRRVQWAIKPLRKRLALRFAVLGPVYEFAVSINGEAVGPQDVDYYKKVELAWAYGLDEGSPEREKLSAPPRWENRPPSIKISVEGVEQEFHFKGWLACTRHPSDLEDNGVNYGGVIVLMRGKVAHENATLMVNDDHLFTKYLVGEIHADFLDDDSQEDIATSSRQGLIEADPRVTALKAFLKREFGHVNQRWSAIRADNGSIAVEEVPAIKSYLDSLNPEPRKQAKKFLGKIWSIHDVYGNTVDLLKSGILFCENLRVQDAIGKLDRVEAFDFVRMSEAFELVGMMEAAQYHQLVQVRTKVIEAFQKITSEDEKEKVLQRYVAENLWLLNPSWDVVPTVGANQVEVRLSEVAKELKGSGSQEERDSRLDILYSRTGTNHVIIELKRYSAKPSEGTLVDQVRRYRREVREILDTAGRRDNSIEVYILLGKHPGRNPRDRQEIDKTFENIDAQIVLYDEIIDGAQQLHAGYLKIASHTTRLQGILDLVDTEAPKTLTS